MRRLLLPAGQQQEGPDRAARRASLVISSRLEDEHTFDTLGPMGGATAQSHQLPDTVPDALATVPGISTGRADTRLLAVDPALAGLLPDQALRRGSVLALSGPVGSTSFLFSLLARTVAEGSWAGVVGIPALGVEAAAGMGLRLDHLALVPDPGKRWLDVVAALLDVVDVVVISPPGRCRPPDARRLAARARERGAVLMVTEPVATGGARPSIRWPEVVDLRFEIDSCSWHGLDRGDGTLGCRQVVVRSSGRRGGARERVARLWLPAADGTLAPVGPAADGRLANVNRALTE